jgi:hypothetical protein
LFFYRQLLKRISFVLSAAHVFKAKEEEATAAAAEGTAAATSAAAATRRRRTNRLVLRK